MCRNNTSFTNSLPLLIVPLVLLAFLPSAYAFGAGSIPDYSYLKDVAFRHGDIESVIEELSKLPTGGHGSSGGLLGVAGGLAGAIFGGGNNGGGINVGDVLKAGATAVASGGKFSGLDVKRIYLGNFLRDYSQACDIAGLSKLSVDSIVLVITVLSFMVFGYASDEFEITKEKIGVYLPVEHIDNPKGYAADQENGDARPYDSRLRPPVLDEELEIDPNNGMKNYIATSSDRWDTSADCMRRTLQKCIELGRRSKDQPDSLDRYEAYRLLGTALHTSEDLMAHSNWMEIALQKLGYRDVFTHVGDNVRVRAPNGEQVPPLVTGTFGSADFIYSLLGEAGDKLSSATVGDVMSKMDDAKNNQQGEAPLDVIKNVLSKANQGGDSQSQQKLQNAEEIRKGAVNLNPDDIASDELQKQLWQVLSIRDDVMKSIEGVIDTIPGLSELMDSLVNAITVYILTTIEPFVKPVMTSAIEGLQQGSAAVIDRQDQWEVFNDANASDPTHSVISKDHFDLILNEPGGQLAKIIVKYIVPLIVEAWFNDEDANRVIDQVLQVLHHPYWARDDSPVHRQLFDHLRSWIEGKPESEKREILEGLTKDSIRQGRNKRKNADSYGEPGHSHGAGGGAYAIGAGQKWSGHGHAGGGGRPQQSGGYGGQQQSGGYGGQQQSGGYGGQQQSGGYGRQEQSGGYGSQQSGGYGRQEQSTGYDSQQSGGYGRQEQSTGYGSQQSGGYGRQEQSTGYGSQGRQEQQTYGGRRTDEDEDGNRRTGGGGYGSSGGYGARKDDDEDDNRRTGGGGGYGSSGGYGGRRDDDEDNNRRTGGGGGYGSSGGYGGRRDDDEDNNRRTGGGGGYGQSSYGRSNDDDDNERRGGGGGGYGQSSYGRSNDDDNERRGGGGGYGQSSYGRSNDDDNERRGGGGGHGQSSYGRSNDDDNERRGDVSERFGQMNIGQGGYGRRDDDDNRGGYGGGGYGRD